MALFQRSDRQHFEVRAPDARLIQKAARVCEENPAWMAAFAAMTGL